MKIISLITNLVSDQKCIKGEKFVVKCFYYKEGTGNIAITHGDVVLYPGQYKIINK